MQSSGEDNVVISKSLFVTYKQTPIEENYEIRETLVEGSVSTILRGINRSTGHTRAIKKMKKTKELTKNNLELEILKKLSHPHIMEVYEAYEDKNHFYIIAELCQGSELYEMILKKKTFHESDAAVIMQKLLSAINYCHQNQIVHRDIRPENIIVDTKLDIKLIEWGTARRFERSKLMSVVKNIGPYYLSPEVISGVYDEKCDIWSLGVILYILLCGYPPFNGSTKEQIIQTIQAGVYDFPENEWEDVSDEAKSLVKAMLTYDSEQRPSAADCISYPFFQIYRRGEDKTLSKSIITNMKKFHVDSKIQQAALIFMTNHLLTNREKQGMIKAFENFDKNGDGVISKSELYEVLSSSLGEDEAKKEIEKTLKKIDIDQSGYIDFNEFVLASIDRQKLLIKDKLEATFKMFDVDGNGYITQEEFVQILGKSLENSGTFMSLLKEVDIDGDSEISFNEFKLIMSKLIS